MTFVSDGAGELLLVDDNEADLLLAKELLAEIRAGCRVVTVQDAEAAIALLRSRSAIPGGRLPDLVITDFRLGATSARDVLLALKGDAALRRIPVIVLTSSDAPPDVLEAYDLGASCYLRKPDSLEEFGAMLRALVDFWLGIALLPNRVG